MVMLIKYTLTKVNNEIGAKSSLGRKACSYGMLGARRPRARGGAERAGGVAHPAGTAGRLAAYLPNSFRKIAH